MRALISFHSVTIAAVLVAGTALPLILAVPLGSMPRDSGELTATPMEFTPVERVSTQAAPVAAATAEATTRSEMPFNEAPCCPTCNPDGWPAGVTGYGCPHGIWARRI